ncbi:protein PBDC1-like [Ostrea edulis]|uniref:protein PBDC1-like n=1 Tax=Ostrea edulis TaxID=37623 RepID=UPI0020957D36|nr:protein PBDC1-like [Ostrea edulis]
MANLSDFNATELNAAGSQLTNDASKYGNNPDLEMQWAVKSYHHAETYFNLICSVDPTVLKLTKIDDDLYTEFRKEFPDLKIDIIQEDQLKSVESKAKWRPFLNAYEKIIEDFNFGTLLRLDCSKAYTEENSILVVRIQFLAIEIARNREGYNSPLRLQKREKSEQNT